jgi:hypothetical protein
MVQRKARALREHFTKCERYMLFFSPLVYLRYLIPHNFRAFYCRPPISVHCKKYLQLQPWVSAVSRKKQIQLILESLEVEKPGFFHVRSLHCCHALLKIKKHKSLYLRNHNR